MNLKRKIRDTAFEMDRREPQYVRGSQSQPRSKHLLLLSALILCAFGLSLFHFRRQLDDQSAWIPKPTYLDFEYIEKLAFSPDNQTLAIVSRSHSPDGSRISLADAQTQTGRDIHYIPVKPNTPHSESLNDKIAAMSFSPDGKILAAAYAGEPYPVQLIDVATGKVRRILQGQKSSATVLSFSSDGKSLVASGEPLTNSEAASFGKTPEGHIIRYWDVTTGRLNRTLRLPIKEVLWSAFSPDNQSVVTLTTATRENTDISEVKQWNLVSGRLIRTFKRFPEAVREVAMSPDWKTLAVTGSHATTLWNTSTGARRRAFKRQIDSAAPHSLFFSPDGTLLAGADSGMYKTEAMDGTRAPYSKITIWSLHTGKSINLSINPSSPPWLRGQVSGSEVSHGYGEGPLLLFSPGGETLVAGAGWDIESAGHVLLWKFGKLKAQLNSGQ